MRNYFKNLFNTFIRLFDKDDQNFILELWDLAYKKSVDLYQQLFQQPHSVIPLNANQTIIRRYPHLNFDYKVIELAPEYLEALNTYGYVNVGPFISDIKYYSDTLRSVTINTNLPVDLGDDVHEIVSISVDPGVVYTVDGNKVLGEGQAEITYTTYIVSADFPITYEHGYIYYTGATTQNLSKVTYVSLSNDPDYFELGGILISGNQVVLTDSRADKIPEGTLVYVSYQKDDIASSLERGGTWFTVSETSLNKITLLSYVYSLSTFTLSAFSLGIPDYDPYNPRVTVKVYTNYHQALNGLSLNNYTLSGKEKNRDYWEFNGSVYFVTTPDETEVFKEGYENNSCLSLVADYLGLGSNARLLLGRAYQRFAMGYNKGSGVNIESGQKYVEYPYKEFAVVRYYFNDEYSISETKLRFDGLGNIYSEIPIFYEGLRYLWTHDRTRLWKIVRIISPKHALYMGELTSEEITVKIGVVSDLKVELRDSDGEILVESLPYGTVLSDATLSRGEVIWENLWIEDNHKYGTDIGLTSLTPKYLAPEYSFEKAYTFRVPRLYDIDYSIDKDSVCYPRSKQVDDEGSEYSSRVYEYSVSMNDSLLIRHTDSVTGDVTIYDDLDLEPIIYNVPWTLYFNPTRQLLSEQEIASIPDPPPFPSFGSGFIPER